MGREWRCGVGGRAADGDTTTSFRSSQWPWGAGRILRLPAIWTSNTSGAAGRWTSRIGQIGMLEAVDRLLEQGFEPNRTIYLSLGHDEEVGGVHGNQQIAEWMRSQGIRLEFVLDEGGCIYEDFTGLDRPVVLVGVAEKGYVTVRLAAELAAGGHSSMPPKHTAIGILAEALHRLHQHPLPQRLDGGAGLTLDFVGPEMPLANRIAISNRWLFAPLIESKLAATPVGNASLSTTMAPTMIEGGVKENVLPTKAELTINVRILPGDTVDTALEHIRRAVGDERVSIQTLDIRKERSRMSRTDWEHLPCSTGQ